MHGRHLLKAAVESAQQGLSSEHSTVAGARRRGDYPRRQHRTAAKQNSKSMFKNVKIYFFSLKVAAIDGGECGAHESTGFCRAATSWCGAVAAGARGRHDKKNNNKVKNKVKKTPKAS